MRTNTSRHNSPNGSDFERLNDPKVAQEEDNKSESNSSTSNRDTNEGDNSTAIGSHASSAHLKRRRKHSDIHTQSQLTTYRGALYFQCNYCPQKHKETGGTKTMRDHLIKVYSWYGMTSVQLKKKRKNQQIEAILERSAPGEAKRLQAKRAELLKDSINKKTLDYLYIRYTVNANALFSHVEHPDFRVLLRNINPAANNALPNSHNTIQSRVMELYAEGKRRVSFMLQGALSSIHITCDAWTISNHLGALDVVSHFTSKEELLRELLLLLSEQEGSHSGQNPYII